MIWHGVFDLNEPSPEPFAVIREPEVQAAIHRTPSPKAVADFTRVCEQTGLIDKLRKE
jgi:hypothetical protein